MVGFSDLDIVTPALRQAVGGYMEYGRQAGWPLRTAQTRERHLLTFLLFLAFNDIGTLNAVTPTLVQEFSRFLAAAPLHPGLIQSYLHSVALFLRWCSTHPRLALADGVVATAIGLWSTTQGGRVDD